MTSTKIIDVRSIDDELNLSYKQLPLIIDDNKVMILQLSDFCEYCNQNKKEHEYRKGKHNTEDHHIDICYTSNSIAKKGKQSPEDGHDDKIKRKLWSEEIFLKQYSKLSKDEALEATKVSSKTLFARLSQVVGCVGCRRSVEKLFNQLRDSDYPAMDPLVINSSGILTVFMNYSLQPKVLNRLFSNHKTPLNEMLEIIPKSKKSGRCILHSLDSVRFRAGTQFCFDMWKSLSDECKKTICLINIDQLLATLDNYLRKHRFCHECKNKVHRAYNILVGTITIDPNKEKGYVASLYAGITRSEGFINVCPSSDVVSTLLTRAEPELQGRDSLFLSRERHAKTLEIAQEEVLTCLGLFLHERLQKIFCRMRDEEQSYDILFHIGLDLIRRNFEMAVEEKQGFSKFEKFCEELQKEELIVKAKKEKKNRKKKNAKKKNEETKENTYVEESMSNCDDCEINRTQSPLKSQSREVSEPSEGPWCVVGAGGRKQSRDRLARSCSEGKDAHSVAPLECAISIDSLASRCSQCSRDGGYCSAQCSSRDSSEVACGEGFCSHSSDDTDAKRSRECSIENDRLSPPKQIYAPSLTEMLDADSSCEVDEIPEAEVLAWHARLGAVKQKRAELRQTLRQRFQQLCHRRSLSALNGQDEAGRCLHFYSGGTQANAIP